MRSSCPFCSSSSSSSLSSPSVLGEVTSSLALLIWNLEGCGAQISPYHSFKGGGVPLPRNPEYPKGHKRSVIIWGLRRITAPPPKPNPMPLPSKHKCS